MKEIEVDLMPIPAGADGSLDKEGTEDWVSYEFPSLMRAVLALQARADSADVRQTAEMLGDELLGAFEAALEAIETSSWFLVSYRLDAAHREFESGTAQLAKLVAAVPSDVQASELTRSHQAGFEYLTAELAQRVGLTADAHDYAMDRRADAG